MSEDVIKELDVVALTTEVTGLPRGSVGTIVMVFEAGVLEMEFADDKGCIYGVTSIRDSQLLRLNFGPS